MENYEREEKTLKETTTTSVLRSRRWAFTTANVEGGDTYDLGNVTLYLGPIEKDSLGVSHRHGIACRNVLKSGREGSIEKLSLLKKMEAAGLKITYIASIKNLAGYINYAFKEGQVPEELQKLTKASVRTNNQNYFQDLAKEVAAEFSDKPSANLFKQRILEKCFAYPQSLLKRAYEQCTFGEESRLQRKIRKKTKALEPEPFTAEELRSAFWRITENFESGTWNGET